MSDANYKSDNMDRCVGALHDARGYLKLLVASLDSVNAALMALCSESSSLGATGEGSVGEDTVYVERLSRGKHEIIYSVPAARGARLKGAKRYDIVVDEPGNAVIVIPESRRIEHTLHVLPGMQRGMLYLVLTHVGRTLIYEEIESLFNLDVEPTSLYLYRCHLKSLLGEDLRDRIISRAHNRSHDIPRETWSFLWIRECEEPKASKLLRGVGKRRRKSARARHTDI